MSAVGSLSGGKRTLSGHSKIDVNDPQRTLGLPGKVLRVQTNFDPSGKLNGTDKMPPGLWGLKCNGANF
jgi:hypothetical protein